MDKAPDAFRTISEVADDLDIPQHVLRFWETRFSQIKPMKRSGGRRYYRPDDVDLLRGIRRLLYGEGYTIRGVQRILKENGIKAVQGLVDSPAGAGPAFAPVRAEPVLRAPAVVDEPEPEEDVVEELEEEVEDDADPESDEGDEDEETEDEEEEDGEQDVDAGEAPAARRAPDVVPRVLAESRANYIARAPEPAPQPRPAPAAPPRRLDRERLEAVLGELQAARQMLDAAMKDG